WLGDINGDGRDDVGLTHNSSFKVVFGGGTTLGAAQYAAGTILGVPISLGDLDTDGYNDLAVVGSSVGNAAKQDTVRIFSGGTGSPLALTHTITGVQPLGSYDVTLVPTAGDFDGDHRP